MKKVILSIAFVAALAVINTNVQAATVSNGKNFVEQIAQDDNGFVDVKFEELNEKVQDAVRALIQEYDLNALQYNAEKQITKVAATKKDDQSNKVFYFNAEGEEITLEAPAETVENQTEEQAPSAEMGAIAQDNGFVDVKFEDLNEKVQAAVRAINEAYELNALQYNADKQITKVEATKKDDQSQKTFLLDAEGEEIVPEQPQQEQQETEEVI